MEIIDELIDELTFEVVLEVHKKFMTGDIDIHTDNAFVCTHHCLLLEAETDVGRLQCQRPIILIYSEWSITVIAQKHSCVIIIAEG